MDQNMKMVHEWTGARALMTNASEISSTGLWDPHLLQKKRNLPKLLYLLYLLYLRK